MRLLVCALLLTVPQFAFSLRIMSASAIQLYSRAVSKSHLLTDYPVGIWAAHRLGAIVSYVTLLFRIRDSFGRIHISSSCANPAYTPEELAYQLTITKAFILIVHPDSLETALTAARQTALAADHIFLIDELKFKSPIPLPTISSLVKDGLLNPLSFNERKLAPGEGKTKIAYLSFSSGTTGKPKVDLSDGTSRTTL